MNSIPGHPELSELIDRLLAAQDELSRAELRLELLRNSQLVREPATSWALYHSARDRDDAKAALDSAYGSVRRALTGTVD